MKVSTAAPSDPRRAFASPAASAEVGSWPTFAAGACTVRDALLTPAAMLLAGVRWVSARPAVLAALTVLLVCVPLGSRNVSATAHITPGDIGAAVLAVVASVQAFAGRRLPRSRLWWAMAAAAVGFASATLASIDPANSASGFVRYIELFVIVPLAMAVALRTRRDALLVCAAVLVAALIEGTVGTVQYLTRTGASYEGQNVRAVGTFNALDIQAMAAVVGYGVVVAFGLAVALRGRARRWLLVVAVLLVPPLLLSLSRGALIATIAALLAMLLVARPRVLVPVVVYGGAVVLLITGLVGPRSAGVDARLASITASTSAPDQSVTDRYVLWKTAASMWRDHPVAGVGLKEFPAYRDSFAPVNVSSGSDVEGPGLSFQREPLLSPHNMYLLVLSEQGVIGALAMGGLLLGVAATATRRTTQARPRSDWPDGRAPDGRVVSVAAVGVVIWTLVNFMYGDIGGQTTVLMAVLLGLALWWAVQPPASPEGAVRTPTSPEGAVWAPASPEGAVWAPASPDPTNARAP